mgnify:CR=1 FL=1
MRVLIGGFLISLGAMFGVMYDQSMVVLPLQREVKLANERVDLYGRALDACTKNKHKKGDYLLDQARLINRQEN